ncbi:MAG: Tol-Pal system beta propeller repeat protein TolB [Gammaproteobacteria bacterium]|nr:Tol-Pal system beta propeller repeat protein TolB [Gammaproteobacteria bacterium]
MRTRLMAVLSLAAALLLGAGAAHADLVIKITQGVSQPTPIAVVPFAWKGAGTAPVDVAQVVGNDLARSGLFAPLPVSQMLAQPTTKSEVQFVNWRAVNVNYLVIGSIAPAGDRLLVRFRLFNVYTGQQLLGYILPTTRENLRFTAHVVSNMVYKSLTGVRGAFTTRIAYIKQMSNKGPWKLIVADADGANAQVIVRSPGLLMSPDWSPDGKRIAYVQYHDNQSHIYVQNVATGKRRMVLAHPGVNSAPAFSPDGNRLVVALSSTPANTDLYLLDLASGDLRRLTHSAAIDTEPAWMPSGNTIVFTSDRGGSPQIYALELDDGSMERLTWNGSYNTRAAVAPDGKRLALVHRGGGALRIAVLDLESGNMKLLTDGPLDRSPSFAPNGEMILYDSLTGSGARVLATVSVDSRVREELSGATGGLSQPAWGPFPPRPPILAAPSGT